MTGHTLNAETFNTCYWVEKKNWRNAQLLPSCCSKPHLPSILKVREKKKWINHYSLRYFEETAAGWVQTMAQRCFDAVWCQLVWHSSINAMHLTPCCWCPMIRQEIRQRNWVFIRKKTGCGRRCELRCILLAHKWGKRWHAQYLQTVPQNNTFTSTHSWLLSCVPGICWSCGEGLQEDTV